MTFHPDNRRDTWPVFRPTIIAHDVGRSRDRSTAVVGGNSPFGPRRVGHPELEELPQGLYGSARASALAAVDRRQHSEALIVADLSNDPTYAEVLFDTFGQRVIGLHISRSGDGMNFERRPVKHSAMLVYTIGRSYLLELFHAELQADEVRFVDSPMSAAPLSSSRGLRPRCGRAGQSTRVRQDNTTILEYHAPCWPGRPGIRIWSAWVRTGLESRRPRRHREQQYGWASVYLTIVDQRASPGCEQRRRFDEQTNITPLRHEAILPIFGEQISHARTVPANRART